MSSDPRYAFDLAGVDRLLNVLGTHNLTCTLSIPTSGEVWRTVYDQISAHLSNHGITAQEVSDSLTSPFFSTPMFLLMPQRLRGTNPRRLVETEYTASLFTATTLASTSQKLIHPGGAGHLPLLFFGSSGISLFIDDVKIP
jgi:hypothetical protein